MPESDWFYSDMKEFCYAVEKKCFGGCTGDHSINDSVSTNAILY
jgi:hypothetical protein